MRALAIVLVMILAAPVSARHPARHAKFRPAGECVWPKSECTNGWVDRMTGCCPYRGKR